LRTWKTSCEQSPAVPIWLAGGDPASIELGGVRLAEAVWSVASEDSRDVEALKRGALEAMALYYKRRGQSD
jgi:hypothetical protein